MPRDRGILLRILQLGALLSLTSASSIRAPWLLERDDTCAANFTKCSEAGLPANFCCKQGQDCSVLAGNTTVLCCPTGSDCSVIEPINCNLSLQDPATNPTAEVKTTVLDGKLPTCGGGGCCPFGYHCDAGAGNCVKDADQSQKPGASTSTTATPSSPTTTSPGKASTSATTPATTPATSDAASATPSTDPTAAKISNTASIVGGVIGALVGLALIGACLWYVRHRRNKKEAERKKHDSTESFGNIISNPIPHANYMVQRQDFLAKAQSSSVSTPATQAQERFAPQSPYAPRPDSHMSGGQDSLRSHHTSAEIRGLRNLTDRQSHYATVFPPHHHDDPFMSDEEKQRSGSGSSESIAIHFDHAESPGGLGVPVAAVNNRDTTWNHFQQQAILEDPGSPVRRRQ